MHDRATWPRGHHTAARSGFAIALVAAVVACAAQPVDASNDLEYPVKAEFLERFTHFIGWPAASFASADSTFVVCVMGANPFGAYLANLIATRRLQGRPAELRSVSDPTKLDGCHLVFIAASERDHLYSIVKHTDGRPILTVGDTEGFARAGVLINLYIDDDNVRFEINVAAVKDSGLKFSSKLFKLAQLVDAEPPR
jgi:hypothetical protein